MFEKLAAFMAGATGQVSPYLQSPVEAPQTVAPSPGPPETKNDEAQAKLELPAVTKKKQEEGVAAQVAPPSPVQPPQESITGASSTGTTAPEDN